jgi:hypothetical protein
LKKSYDVGSLVLRTLLLLPFADIAWGVGQHHDQGLEVDTFQYVLYTPAGGVGHLPNETEGAMGGLEYRL